MGEQGTGGRKATAEPPRDERRRKVRLIPLLCPASFAPSGFSAKRIDPSRPDSPFIVLARDYHDRWQLAPSSLNFDEHFARALRNLRRRKERAEWLRPDGPSGPANVLLRMGDALTASDLLDQGFLRAAAALLGADEVFVAVPTRESMVLSADFALVAQFALARLEDLEPDEFAIGAQIFRCNANGLELIAGVARPEAATAARAEARAREPGPQPEGTTDAPTTLAFDTAANDEADDESLGYMPMGLELGSPDGSTMILLALTEPNLESAERKIRVLLERRLQGYAAKPSFGGLLRVQLNPEMIEANASNQARLEQILSRTNAELERRDAITVSGNPIRVIGGIGHPGQEAPSPSRQKRAPRSPGSGGADKAAAREAQAAEDEALTTAVVESPATAQKRELALIAGGVLALGTISARSLVAFDRLGSSALFQLSTLTPVACLIALSLAVRGVPYARFVLLGFSLASLVWSLPRLNESLAGGAAALTPLAFASALGFAAATLFLAVGRARSRRAPPRGKNRHQTLLGFSLGIALSLVTPLAEVPRCVERAAFPRVATCRALDATTCSKVPGCRAHPPRCAIDCRKGFGDECPAACEESGGRCQPLACSWSVHTNALGQSTRSCGPSGLCVEQADQCVEGCSTLSTRDACRQRAFCGFSECEGTATLACDAFSAADCPLEVCELRGY
jgi:hypothetical protein